MLNIRVLEKRNLSEYLENDFNQGIYNYYHEFLNKKHNIQIKDIEGFFYSIYQEVLILLDNYELTPYETNEYFKGKSENIKPEESLITIIKYRLIIHIVRHLTTATIRNNDGSYKSFYSNYIYFNPDLFSFPLEIENKLMPFVFDVLKSKPDNYFNSVVIENLEKYIKDIEYLKNPKKVSDFKKFVETKIINKTRTKLEKPFSDIFKDLDSFLIFDEFIKKHIVNPYKDISFLFKMLKSEKRLLNITHLEFAEMLLSQEYIKEKEHKVISDKKGFESKNNIQRLNNYYNIVNEIDRIKP